MSHDFEALFNEFDEVMSLSLYDSSRHENVLRTIKDLLQTIENSEGIYGKVIKDCLQELKTSYIDYISELRNNNSANGDCRTLCFYDYSKLKKNYSETVKYAKSNKIETNDKDISQTTSVPAHEISNEITSRSCTSNSALLANIEALTESNRQAEKEIKTLQSIVEKKEREIEDLYKKYANENSDKEHYIRVINFYLNKNYGERSEISKMVNEFKLKIIMEMNKIRSEIEKL